MTHITILKKTISEVMDVLNPIIPDMLMNDTVGFTIKEKHFLIIRIDDKGKTFFNTKR